MKKMAILLGAFVIISTSCQKNYDCVCTSVSKKRDTLMAEVKTTKLGRKGFKDDCVKNETLSVDLVNCRLQ